jgi:hypothetical protein
VYYQPVPRKKAISNFSAATENITYKVNRIYKKDSLVNSISETIKPKTDEIFLCVDIDVTNSGDKTVFYVSLVDDPKIETGTNIYYPDLTLSMDPFGEINPKKTVSGFLVFRIPADEKPTVFKISNLIKNIDF